jgi:putative membrane protein
MSMSASVSADPLQILLADQGHLPLLRSSDSFLALHDRNWDGPGAWWPIFPILWLLVIAVIVVLCVRFGRRHRAYAGTRAGEARLAERFAAGEINEQEYRERRAVLKEDK